jgi:polysaccharide deacetylase family protein (PEP-CTERM system associated)
VQNAITIDLEDWYHVLYYESAIDRSSWDGLESRVEATTHRALDLLDRVGSRATFFVLGWVAERRRDLVREISARGHEVGSHSYAHRLVHQMTRAEFVDDLRRSIDVIAAASGTTLRGYRAPSFSVTEATPWFFEELCAAGLEYDSSVLPMLRYYGGMPFSPRHPYRVKVGDGASLREFPIPTYRLLGRNICFAGGGYLRVLPVKLVERGIEGLNRAGHPGMIYFHPWELDPEGPRVPLSWRQRVEGRFSNELFRRGVEGKLEHLLRRFRFAPMGEVLDASLPARAVA